MIPATSGHEKNNVELIFFNLINCLTDFSINADPISGQGTKLEGHSNTEMVFMVPVF